MITITLLLSIILMAIAAYICIYTLINNKAPMDFVALYWSLVGCYWCIKCVEALI